MGGGVTLQDIALSILTRPVKERWQKQSAADDLSRLLKMVSELLKDAITKDFPFAKQYGNTFYELALLIFVGLPSQWNEVDQTGERPFYVEHVTPQQRFETELGAIMKDLIPPYHRASHVTGDWEQEMFSIIGMAAAVYADSGRETARLVAVEAISIYRDLIAADNAQDDEPVYDDAWDYLQLVSVWARHLLKDSALADELVDTVANERPFHFSSFGLSGKNGWGAYGYPNVSLLNSDFCFPRPGNIEDRLGQPVWETLGRWQERLMNPNELRDTYERVQKIREPIHQRMMERYRSDMERRRAAKAAKAEENKETPVDDPSEPKDQG
jgi:hypothetical protein